MSWTVIITAILGVVGPILSDLLKKWLEKLLGQAAAKMQASPVDTADASETLLQKALEMTPRVRIIRRALLRHMITEVPAVAATGGKLPKAVSAEMKALASQDDA